MALITHKRSSVSGKIPTSDQCEYGELLINYSSGTGASFFSTKKADDTIATFHEDSYWDNKITETVVITLPALNDDTPVEKEVGLQGETTQMFSVSEENFYDTIGAESGITCDEYYTKLQKSLVLINGNPNDYDGNPMIAVPFIERYDNNEIMLTIHVHNWTGGVDGVISNSMADLLVSINFDDLTVGFALTLWTYDEAHMAAPYKIGIVTSFNNRESNDEDLIITMQLKDYNKENVTSKFVIDLLKEGKRVIFGSWDNEGEWESANGEYDVWAYSDNQLVIRWANMSRGKSINSTHYFSHSYSILVFDTNGCLEYNDTQDTPVKGCVYYYKPIMGVSGDTYVTAVISADTVNNKNILKINANVVAIDDAVEDDENPVDGLVSSIDAKEHITSLSNRLEALENAPNNSADVKKETLKFYYKLGQTNADLKPYANSLRESMLGMEDFAKLGTGLFIHWGVYSVPAGNYTGTKQEGSTVTSTKLTRNCEWLMRDLAVPVDTYKAYQAQFNTTKWNAEEIAQMAEDAGMSYIVITAKHHEGFSLYPTNYGYWDVRTAGTTIAPCSLTILDDLKAACDKHHLKFGLYVSQYADWCAEGGFNRTTNKNWNGSSADLFTEAQHNAYLNRTCEQMKEMIERFDPYIIWWDPVGAYDAKYQNIMVNSWINDYPQVITNDRITYDRAYGDYGTGERTIYLRNTLKYGEACFTMNNTWGYSDNNETDSWYYTHEMVFKQFILYSLMYGQNCLMNVGPKNTGEIPSRQIGMLTAMKNFADSYGSFKGYKRVCYNAIPKWGYMIQIGDNTVMCYVIAKNNPTSQNVTIDCVDTDNLASVEILTPANGASYNIHDGKIDITNLGLDDDTKVGVVKLNYTIAPQMPDANMLSANEELPACAFPYTNGNFSYNFGTSGSYGSTKFTNDIYYAAKPSSNASLSSAFIWKGDTNTYTISPSLTSDSLDTDTYIITLKDSAGTTQTINFNGSITNNTDTVNLVNGEKYTLTIKFTGSTTAATIKFYGISFVPFVEIIHVESVSLDYNTTVVEIDGTAQLTATVLPADANDKSVTWSTDNAAIATVEDGLIVGVAAGETTIHVTTVDGSKTDSCIVTVTAAAEDIVPVDSITISPKPVTLQIGGTSTLSVTTSPVNATYQSVIWSSSDESKVTVADGVVTAVGIGSAVITVKNVYDETKFDTCVVTVEGIPVESISLDQNTLSMTPGYYETLTATVLPANATDSSVNWSSSDALKAEVDNTGKIFAKAAGTVTITATSTDGAKVASCTLTVLPETYEYIFERFSLDGSNGQGEIATFQDENSANYGENILLFSDEMTNWTLFGYVHDCINKYQNGSTTTVETNQTLYQCVVDASPWSGVRVDGNNAVSKAIGTHIPMRFRFMAGSDNYVNATTGEAMGSSVQELASAPKHPICFSRDGSTYKFSADGENWTEFAGLNSTQLARVKDAILTVAFDYKRSGGAMTTTEYRHLYTESPCCVSLKAISEYPFYTLYQKYDSTRSVACADIVISTADITLAPGETYQLNPTLSPAHCTSIVVYSSSDTSNATVSSNGLISYVSSGEADITVTCDTVVKTIHVICSADIEYHDITTSLTGVSITPSLTEVADGSQYTATLAVTNNGTMLGNVTVKMGGVDITTTAYDSATATIHIDSVTDELEITAVANEIVEVTFTLDDTIKIDGTAYNSGDTLDVYSTSKINWLNSILND